LKHFSIFFADTHTHTHTHRHEGIALPLLRMHAQGNEGSVDGMKLSSCEVTSGNLLWRDILHEHEMQDRERRVGEIEGCKQHDLSALSLKRPCNWLALSGPFLTSESLPQTG